MNEFHTLVNSCNQKFISLEQSSLSKMIIIVEHIEENDLLRKQIEKLNDQVYQYSLKEIKFENDTKEFLQEKENQIKYFNQRTLELNNLEENLKEKYEKYEKNTKENYISKQTEIKDEYMKEISELSKEIQVFTINCEKLKLENQKLNEKNEEISNLITVKENEFKQMISNKNLEKENLMKMLFEVNEEMILLENKFNSVNSELNENNSLLLNELNIKSETVKKTEEEFIKMKEFIDNLQHNYNSVSLKLKKKEGMYDQLKNQHIVRLL